MTQAYVQYEVVQLDPCTHAPCGRKMRAKGDELTQKKKQEEQKQNRSEVKVESLGTR